MSNQRKKGKAVFRSLTLEGHGTCCICGVDSKMVKAPFIWHDILHVLNVISKYEWLMNNSRLTEMVDIVKLEADNEKSAHSNQCGKHSKIGIFPENSLHNS